MGVPERTANIQQAVCTTSRGEFDLSMLRLSAPGSRTEHPDSTGWLLQGRALSEFSRKFSAMHAVYSGWLREGKINWVAL